MSKISKKEKIISFAIYITLSVIFCVTTLAYLSLLFFAAFGIIFYLINRFTDSKIKPEIYIFSVFCAAMSYNALYFLYYNGLNKEDKIKAVFAVIIFILCVFLCFRDKMFFTIPAPIILYFLNVQLAVAMSALLLCFAIIRIGRNKKSFIAFTIWFALCTIGIFIAATAMHLYMEQSGSLKQMINVNRNLFTIAAVTIFAIIMLFVWKAKCNFKALISLIIISGVIAEGYFYFYLRHIPIMILSLGIMIIFAYYWEAVNNKNFAKKIADFYSANEYLIFAASLLMIR
jgi:hypothetical protein